MTVAVRRLNEGARVAVKAHLLALSPQDRSMRFGASLASDFIAAYVDRIDFAHDAVFGIRDDRLDLVGVAHVAFGDDLAELALSVLPGHRGRGVGSALFERAVAHARKRSTPKLFMHFLAGNAPIMRIAQKFSMDIFTSAGSADAYLRLIPGPSAVTIAAGADEPFECSPIARGRPPLVTSSVPIFSGKP